MRGRLVPIALLALLLAPGALGHGSESDGHTEAPPAPVEDVVVPRGYTGPGREPWISYFQGVWLYGEAAATPIRGQVPRHLDGDGDWLVWEDANRSDIYVHNLPSGQGFYVTSDAALQRNPRVSDDVVVWEDHSNPRRPRIMAYFLETGETRRLSNTTTIVRDPSIGGPIVAWIDENGTNADAWAYDLRNNTAWNLHAATDRDNDATVVRERVFWRTYRYNLWDIMGYDTRTGELLSITSDAELQGYPFTNGDDLFFLQSAYRAGWELMRYDLDDERLQRAGAAFNDASGTSASGDHILRVARDVDFSQLVVRNLTNGATTHVSGDLALAADPILLGDTIHVLVRTIDGASLVSLKVSPFAFAKRPTLSITSPATGASWIRPVVVQGALDAGAEWTEPMTFTYRIDDEPPQLIPPGKSWRVTADPNGMAPGAHSLVVRATFREGPPVATSITLVVPAALQTVDVEAAGPAYHAARIMGEFNQYVLQNPAAYALIPLVLLLLALAIFRFYIWRKPRRRPSAVEYVAPDDA